MVHLQRTPGRILAAFAAALFLSTVTFAQTYTAKAGSSIAGNEDNQTGSIVAEAFWDGTWAQSIRHGFSRAEQGSLKATAYCQTFALYNMQVYAIAELHYDDLVFSSPGSTPIQVGLRLTIEGHSSVVNGNGAGVTLKYAGNQLIGSATRYANGMISANHGLSGWNMNAPFSFEYVITVPVNSPVSLRLHMDVYASAVAGGHIANGEYQLRIGSLTPIAPSCDQFEAFNLPPGVTVSSVQAGIFGNVWTQPSVGTNYCVAGPNSVSSSGAQISATGSAQVSANDLVLTAGPLPAHLFGIFFHGPAQVQLPFGEGFRCTGGQNLRAGPSVSTDAGGFVSLVTDNTGPYGIGILPGVTRYFQVLYRDPLSGDTNGDMVLSGFNLSDGLEICFY